MFWIGLIIGAILGGIIGVVSMALFIINSGGVYNGDDYDSWR
jgi:hypothetical protein